MSYFRRILFFLGVTTLFFGVFQLSASAQESSVLTDSQIVQIRNRCDKIQDILSQVHANDALVRVNRGRLYELISTKLMSRLNSRVAINRLDSTSLVAASTNYETHLKEFRANYQDYEESLSDTMAIDCNDQPANFYSNLQDTRAKRAEVRASTKDIADDVRDYQDAFNEFAKPYQEANHD